MPITWRWQDLMKPEQRFYMYKLRLSFVLGLNSAPPPPPLPNLANKMVFKDKRRKKALYSARIFRLEGGFQPYCTFRSADFSDFFFCLSGLFLFPLHNQTLRIPLFHNQAVSVLDPPPPSLSLSLSLSSVSIFLSPLSLSLCLLLSLFLLLLLPLFLPPSLSLSLASPPFSFFPISLTHTFALSLFILRNLMVYLLVVYRVRICYLTLTVAILLFDIRRPPSSGLSSYCYCAW